MFWQSVEGASLVGDARKEFNAARAMVWPARRRPPPPLPLCLGTYGDEAVAHGDARLPHALGGDEVASESAVAHLGDELAVAAREDVNKWRTVAKTGPSKKSTVSRRRRRRVARWEGEGLAKYERAAKEGKLQREAVDDTSKMHSSR